MGSSTSTKIVDNNDSINVFTRWDGFKEDIGNDLNNLSEIWSNQIYLIKKLFNEKGDLGTYGIKEWIVDMELLINNYSLNKTVDTACVLLSNINLNHNRPIPYAGDKEYLNYLGFKQADNIYNIKKNTFVENYKKKRDNQSIDNLKDFKICEISSEGKQKIGFKFKDLTEEEILLDICLIPLFIRDIYTISKEFFYKKKYDHSFFEKINIRSVPFLKYCLKLNMLYSPTSHYSIRENDKVFTEEEKEADLKNKIYEAIAFSPLEFNDGTLINFLSLKHPGKILPLTNNEISLNRKSDLKIYMPNENSIEIDDEYLTDKFRTSLVKQFNDKEKYFVSNYGLPEANKNFVIALNKKENRLTVDIIRSLVYVMNNQRDIEQINMGNINITNNLHKNKI